jgi:hypothetical protein
MKNTFKPVAYRLLLSLLFPASLSGCMIKEYVAIVQRPILVFDDDRVRYQDIPVYDTITYSRYLHQYARGQHPQADEIFVNHRRYLLIARDVVPSSRVVGYNRYKRRRYMGLYSFHSLKDYPRFILGSPSRPYASPSYIPTHRSAGESHTIHTGPRGGRYYINSKGNKTYVKKGSTSTHRRSSSSSYRRTSTSRSSSYRRR